MMIRICRSTITALLILVHAPIVLAQDGQMRRVTVKVELLDFEGKPAPELAVVVRLAPDAEFINDGFVSRSDGRSEITINVPRSCEALEIVPCAPYRLRTHPRIGAEMFLAFDAMIRRNSFRSAYTLRLDADQNEYSLTVRGEEAITIGCRLVDIHGNLVTCDAVTPDWLCIDRSRPDKSGAFEILGVPKGRPVELVLCGLTEQPQLLELSAEQTAQDFDLGDVTLEPMVGSGAARLMDSNPGSRDPVGSLQYTLISEDGRTIVRAIVDDPSGRLSNVTFRTSERWLAPGKYYLAPRALQDSKDARQLLRLIRDGKAGNHPNLFSFLAIADRDIEVEFDSAEVVRAIKAAVRAEFGDEGR